MGAAPGSRCSHNVSRGAQAGHRVRPDRARECNRLDGARLGFRSVAAAGGSRLGVRIWRESGSGRGPRCAGRSHLCHSAPAAAVGLNAAGVWPASLVDDPEFDVARHVHEVACSPPGDEDALLRAAAGVVTIPLPPGQPLWSATIVTGLAGDACALIVVFHHVLADGMGGLAVLASLADGTVNAPRQDFPRARPSARRLAVDAAVSRVHVLAHLGRVPARLRDALAELRPGATPRAPRCSLNRPVGTRRRFGVVRADLAQVHSVGRAFGGTVNDVVLTAVSGALRAQLARRGERIDQIVVSVPVSGRAEASPAQLGNQIGVTPVMIPASGAPLDRLAAIAEITRRHKSRTRPELRLAR